MHRYNNVQRLTSSIPSVLAGAALLLGSIGCLGDPYEACPDEQRVAINPDDAQIWPPIVHTGFNGRDTFLAPISTNYIVDEWTSSTPQVVSASGYQVCGTPSIYDPAGLLAAEGPGIAQVNARSVDPAIDLFVQVMVTEYTQEDTDIGATRYNESDSNGDPLRVSCASCHEAAGGVDHTPLEMAFHDDEALLAATVDSQYPDVCRDAVGTICECNTAGCENRSPGYRLLDGEHRWNLTEDEVRGIVAYMRSLRPRGI